MSLAAVNQIYVIHEAMNGFKNLKDSLKDCFENVKIILCLGCTEMDCVINQLLKREILHRKQDMKNFLRLYLLFYFDQLKMTEAFSCEKGPYNIYRK